MQFVAKALLGGVAILSLAACTAVQNQRGYVAEPMAYESIVIGQDNKLTVGQKLGNPSIGGTFDNATGGEDTWYYISSFDVQAAFFPVQSEERDILAIKFTPEGQVASLERYGLEDGRVVNYVDRETPTRGRDLTILQQIFNAVPGNIGGNQGQIGQQNPGGGTGAPPPF